MKRRGVGLGTTLIVVALVATLGFIVVGTSISHLQVMSHTSNAAVANDLARSVLHLALARVYQDPQFGTRAGEDRSLSITLPNAPEGSQGLLTFDPANSDVPLSTNNLEGPGSVIDPAGKMVPSQSVLFVAEGRCRGVTRRVEAVLHLPPFPYAAASDGPIVSTGGLQVGSVDADTPAGAPVADLKPATILSNALDAEAIVLGPNSTIKGDLRAGGGIQLDPGGGTTVLGQLYPHSDPRAVPRLVATDYDPGTGAASLDPTYTDASFTGKLRRDGDLEVAHDLELQGALLYVDGDLTVHGSLTGSGILVTTGKLRVEGQTQMDSSDKVALLAQKGVQLLGKGRASSSLRGLIYTEGGFEAQQIRLEGALISSQGGPTSDAVRLEDVSLLKDDSASKVTVDIAPTMSAGSGNMAALHLHTFGAIISHEEVPDPPPANFLYAQIIAQPDGTVYYYACEHLGGQKTKETQGYGDPAVVNQPGQPFYQTLNGKLQDRDYQQMLRQVFQSGSGGIRGGGATPGETITVDPSRLLPLSDAARIVLWRQY